MDDTGRTLLSISDLAVGFDTEDGYLRAVDGVSLVVYDNEVLGLVGESGCGKSVTALSILRLIPRPPGRIESGRILFDGSDILAMNSGELSRLRGASISMIFQDPMAALSPLWKIGDQMAETLSIHGEASGPSALSIAESWLGRVHIPEPSRTLSAYPHELSGGMQQRVMIAMALMLNPRLIIADEPTTALDVTVAAQIFDLLRAMRADRTSVLLITHDLGVVWEMCDRVAVMYAGKIVETARVKELFESPAHPYTQGLLASIPVLDEEKEQELDFYTIEGQVPSPLDYPPGCRFSDRCSFAFERCKKEEPPLFVFTGNRQSACFLAARWIPSVEMR
ncbi:MAG: ABC transporter ATP-binding protein [Thermodesulfobacteriota bacterium]